MKISENNLWETKHNDGDYIDNYKQFGKDLVFHGGPEVSIIACHKCFFHKNEIDCNDVGCYLDASISTAEHGWWTLEFKKDH
jgi:hypothetical protein